jgi:hypothetical protein
VISARRVAELIERWPVDPSNPESLGGYLELLKSQKSESLSLAMLATKMRMAQQTTHNQRGNKQPKATKVPWQR